MNATSIVKARLYWQVGNWNALSRLNLAPVRRESLSAEQIELLLYKMQGCFQIGALEDGRRLARAARQAGISRRVVATGLLGGAYSSLVRARLVNGDTDHAHEIAAASVALNPMAGDLDVVTEMRIANETVQVARTLNRASERKKLFIDCGGYDGCSVLIFLLANPDFCAVSFEPNEEFWPNYDTLPTRLEKKAVYVHDGTVSFIIDPIDGDGSTLIEGKKIDFHNKVSNEECPVVTVPCIDLSRYVREMAEEYDVIVLKLDVEGAEYDILEKMLSEGTLALVDRLYCEFHNKKIPLASGRHEKVLREVVATLPVEDWDSLALGLNVPDSTNMRRKRREFLTGLLKVRTTAGA